MELQEDAPGTLVRGAQDAVQLLGPIRQELLSGAQPDERFEQLKEYLRFYPNLPLDEKDDETAAGYYNRLRQPFFALFALKSQSAFQSYCPG